MAWPFDDPGQMPDFLMRQGAAPSPQFAQPPQMAQQGPSDEELLAAITGANAPQEPLPNDFWARFAQGGQPIQYNPGPRPTGLEALLAVAAGFANAKAGQGARRVDETAQRNTRARDAAKTLANWRHQERIARQQQEATKEAARLAREGRPEARVPETSEQRVTGTINAYRKAGLPVPGTVARPTAPKPSTGQQKAIMGFYLRGKESVDALSIPETDGKSLEQKIADAGLVQQGRMKVMANIPAALSADQQRYVNAQKAFTEARLRKESGAAIAPSEYENDSRIYFQQPGDKPAVVEQKRKMRQKVLDGLKFGAGPAFKEYYEGTQAPDGLSEEDAYRIYLETVGGG